MTNMNRIERRANRSAFSVRDETNNLRKLSSIISPSRRVRVHYCVAGTNDAMAILVMLLVILVIQLLHTTILVTMRPLSESGTTCIEPEQLKCGVD